MTETADMAPTEDEPWFRHGWLWFVMLVPFSAVLFGIVMITAMTVVMMTRTPLGVDVLRARGMLFQEVPGGFVQNIYTLKLLNMDKQDHIYSISVRGLPAYKLVPEGPVPVEAGAIGEVSVNVLVNPDLLTQVNTPVHFDVQTDDGRYSASSKSTFIGPRPLDD